MTESKHLVVISCENWYYHGWQAQVATYSCLKRQKVAPMIVVHGGYEEGLTGEFLACREAGALVVPSKNYRGEGSREWAARNTAASLLDGYHKGKQLGATHIVLMDPDMVWTRRVSWPTTLAVDRCPNDLRGGLAAKIAEDLGLDLGDDPNHTWGARVPYVIPIEIAKDLGEVWWQIMDLFCDLPGWEWSDQMRAFALALAVVGKKPQRLKLTQTNWEYEAPVEAPLIHYAYEYRTWYKKWFTDPADASVLWNPARIPPSYVQGWIHREIVCAHAFFTALEKAAAA